MGFMRPFYPKGIYPYRASRPFAHANRPILLGYYKKAEQGMDRPHIVVSPPGVRDEQT